MSRNFTQIAIFFLFLFLFSCAKEKDFPSQNPYPLLQVTSATADSTGIQVSAEIISTGSGSPKDYGIAYHPISKANSETKVKADALANNKFDIAITNQLIGQTSYEVRAYALVGDKIVYSDYVVVKSLLSSKPVISQFMPTEGASYSEVTITGNNFTEDRNNVAVYFGTKGASIVKHEVDKLVVRVPSGNFFGSFPIRVVANGLEVTSDQKFEIWGPSITGISKTEAVPGETIRLTGKHLDLSSTYITLNNIYNLRFEVLSNTGTEMELKVPHAKGSQFDKPFSMILEAGDKNVTSSFTFTIKSNFQNATQLQANPKSVYMPSFEVNGKGYFFDFDRVLSYATATGLWRVESTFPGPARRYPIWERVGNKAYLIGGTEDYRYWGDVWEYDLLQNTWTKLPSLHFAIREAASFVLDGAIYFTGGYNSLGSYALWKYNPATQQLEERAALPGRGFSGQAFTRKGKAYLMLGGNILEYNPAADTWSNYATYNINNSPYPITTGNSDLYLMTKAVNPVLLKFKETTKTWATVAYWKGCSTSFASDSYFSGFGGNNSVYVGMFNWSRVVESCNQFYSYTP